MKQQQMQRLLALVGLLTRALRQELVDRLEAQSNAEASVEVLESAGSQARVCPHCKSQRLVRNGLADGLQRDKCRACGKTFNALTGTPLAPLRHKDKWLEQSRALADGLTVHRAAESLGRGAEHGVSLAAALPERAQRRQTREPDRRRRDGRDVVPGGVQGPQGRRPCTS